MLKEMIWIAAWLTAPVVFLRGTFHLGLLKVARVGSPEEITISWASILGAFILGSLMSPFFSVEPDEAPEKRRSTNARLWLAGAVYGLVFSWIWIYLLTRNMQPGEWGGGAGMVWMVILGPSYLAGFTLFYSFWPFVSWQWKRFWLRRDPL